MAENNINSSVMAWFIRQYVCHKQTMIDKYFNDDIEAKARSVMAASTLTHEDKTLIREAGYIWMNYVYNTHRYKKIVNDYYKK